MIVYPDSDTAKVYERFTSEDGVDLYVGAAGYAASRLVDDDRPARFQYLVVNVSDGRDTVARLCFEGRGMYSVEAVMLVAGVRVTVHAADVDPLNGHGMEVEVRELA